MNKLDGSERWYFDGSAMNAKWREVCTTGFGIVVTARDGSLLGFGLGTPPSWIRTAPASEAWALSQVLSMLPEPPRMTTDCKSLLSIALRGTHKATAAKAVLARIWCRIAGALDGDTRKLVTSRLLQWTPAHLSQQSIGKTARGTDREVTALDWRANRLADALAKEAAGRHAADACTVKLLKSAEAAARFHMALLGAVTYTANHCRTQQLVKGEMVWVTKRDSLERPKAASAAQRRAKSKRPKPKLEHSVIAEEPQTSSCSWVHSKHSAAQRTASAKRKHLATLNSTSHCAACALVD
jgi:hypothetical protein